MNNIINKIKNIKIEKANDKITSHSGLMLISECFNNFGLRKDIENFFQPPGSNRGYEAHEFIEPLIMAFAGGGQTLEDTRVIRDDKTLLEIIGIEKVPSSDTYGDWLRRMGGNNLPVLDKLNEALVKRTLEVEENIECTVDIDATGIESEKATCKMTYKGYKGYMPMLGIIAENSLIIYNELREGNVSPATDNLGVLRSCISKMPKGKKIKYFRSDSAGYQADVINECEAKDIQFTITAALDSAVKKAIMTIPEKAWEVLKDKEGKETDRFVADAVHCMNKTDKAFSLVVQRWEAKAKDNNKSDYYQDELSFRDETDLEKYRYYIISTNIKDKSNEEIVLHHNGRSNSENINKELKSGFGMNYLPCSDFKANSFFFGLGVMAYNLVIAMKRNLFPKCWNAKTISTIRWQLINTAGKLVKHAGEIVLKVTGISNEILDIWQKARNKLYYQFY